jgi:hypothetical protein
LDIAQCTFRCLGKRNAVIGMREAIANPDASSFELFTRKPEDKR